jgi:hypothetical protein
LRRDNKDELEKAWAVIREIDSLLSKLIDLLKPYLHGSRGRVGAGEAGSRDGEKPGVMG